NSIVELHRVLHGPAASFAIFDGIVGMEGNGPIQGKPKPAGVLVIGSDLVAVDSTCCRIMGIDPERVEYLRLAAARGHLLERDIDQRGESLSAVRTQFELLEDHRVMRLS
ncbi:MAG: DUF362 domain-containing protein, partial [Bryobacteraceae bacterium]